MHPTRIAPGAYLIAMALALTACILIASSAQARDRVERTLHVDGMDRTFVVYMPDMRPGRAMPVLFVFHPALGTIQFMEFATGMHKKAAAEDYIVVYPQGYRRTWNAGTCCGLAEMADVDDVGFFRAMMKDIGTLAPVQPKAYLTGFSNGALMVYHLMCEAGDQVAAAAPFGAYLPPQDMTGCYNGPVPLMHVHGAADKGSPVGGGQTNYLGLLPPAKTTVEAVARRNGANLARPVSVENADLGTTCLRYKGTSAQAEANLCVIPGLGHVWPGMASFGGKLGPARPDLDGSAAVLDFFARH